MAALECSWNFFNTCLEVFQNGKEKALHLWGTGVNWCARGTEWGLGVFWAI